MKSRSTAIVLAFFLGGLGIHEFYLGRFGRGILYFLFFPTFIPAFIGFFQAIAWMSYTDDRFNAEHNLNLVSMTTYERSNKQADKVEILERLAKLKANGDLSEEEYQAQKKSALG